MQILDCTLRDGGYYTDWYFSEELVNNYLKTISQLPISIIELGYLSYNQDYNGPFYHLNKIILKDAKDILRKDQKIYAMINLKEINNFYNLKKLISENKKHLNGIRFAISPYEVNNFLSIIKKIRSEFSELDIGINLMYLSKWYLNKNFLNGVLNKLKNHADIIALVDSYGAIFPEQVKLCLKSIDDKSIKIGCHFHNNCGLALANTLIAIDNGCMIADTTIKGIGRGAGNASTELLIALKKKTTSNITSFDINNLIEKFDILKNNLKWGESYAYAFAAKNGFSQAAMMDLIQKKRLDASIAIKAIESKELNNKKILFTNISNIKKIIYKKKIPILIGGASSLINYGKLLFKNTDKSTTIILSGSNAFFNFIKLNLKIKNHLILILSGSEIKKIQLFSKKNYLSKMGVRTIIIEKNFKPKKINFKGNVIIADSTAANPLLLTGLFLKKIKVKKLNLAFFDGYKNDEKSRVVMSETVDSLKILQQQKLDICTLTKSYLPIKQINPWVND